MTAVSEASGALDRSKVRVGIVDDHQLVSESLAMVLNEQGFYAVGFTPPSFEAVIAFAAEQELHVILLDLHVGDLGTSLPLIPQLRDLGYRVIILTGDDSRAQWGASIEAGAACVVSKAVTFTELLDRVTLLLDDIVERNTVERYELLETWREHRAQERERLAPFEQLTERERAVLLAITSGESADEIAASQFVSVSTVRTHIRSILTKLGVNSQLAAVALATRSGWTASN
jgi:DNA-binding NarL/FixJ family response regulator